MLFESLVFNSKLMLVVRIRSEDSVVAHSEHPARFCPKCLLLAFKQEVPVTGPEGCDCSAVSFASLVQLEPVVVA